MKRGDDAEEEWKIDTLEEDDDRSPALSPRFFNLAKRNLKYTHTEAGMRTLAQLDEELRDLSEIKRESERGNGNDDLSWLIDD